MEGPKPLPSAYHHLYKDLKRLDQTRMDGWFSALTGLGVSQFDKRLSVNFSTDIVTDIQARDLWRGDDMAARIIEEIPKEMFRQGFELQVSEDKELAEAVMHVLDELSFNKAFVRAKEYERAYGGAAIFPVINDGNRDLTQPLNLDRIAKLNYFQVFEPRELHPVRWYTDPFNPKFGMPEIYRVVPLRTGVASQASLELHESRLIIFEGLRVSREQVAGTLTGWGDSRLSRVNAVLRDFNVAWSGAAVLVQEFAQEVIKIDGLAELIAMDRDDVVRMRMQAVQLSKSVVRAVLIDSKEEYERKATPISGLPEMMDKFGTRLAAAAGMPLTKLMGVSPAGLNATGESDTRFWYDTVAAEQLNTTPQLKYGLKLTMLWRGGPTGGKLPKNWSPKWRPLWQSSDMETAQARQVQANIDQIYISNQVVSPEEVAISRFGGDTYSFETVVDFAARTSGEPPADPPAKSKQQEEEAAAAAQQQVQSQAPQEGKSEEPEMREDSATKAIRVRAMAAENACVEIVHGQRRDRKFLVDQARALEAIAWDLKNEARTDSQAVWADRAMAAAYRVRMLVRADAEWNEEDHPRAEDGKFSSGAGGGGKKEAIKEWHKSTMKELDDINQSMGRTTDLQERAEGILKDNPHMSHAGAMSQAERERDQEIGDKVDEAHEAVQRGDLRVNMERAEAYKSSMTQASKDYKELANTLGIHQRETAIRLEELRAAMERENDNDEDDSNTLEEISSASEEELLTQASSLATYNSYHEPITVDYAVENVAEVPLEQAKASAIESLQKLEKVQEEAIQKAKLVGKALDKAHSKYERSPSIHISVDEDDPRYPDLEELTDYVDKDDGIVGFDDGVDDTSVVDSIKDGLRQTRSILKELGVAPTKAPKKPRK